MSYQCPYCGELDCDIEWHPDAWIQGEMSMPITPDNVLAAKIALKEALGEPAWLRSVGTGRDAQGHHLRVYVASVADAGPVPSLWDGIRVQVIGDVRALKT